VNRPRKPLDDFQDWFASPGNTEARQLVELHSEDSAWIDALIQQMLDQLILKRRLSDLPWPAHHVNAR
jgi:hypothetical protein